MQTKIENFKITEKDLKQLEIRSRQMLILGDPDWSRFLKEELYPARMIINGTMKQV